MGRNKTLNKERFIEELKSDISLSNKEILESLNRYIFEHGTRLPSVIVMEELAELQQQVSKQIRGRGDRHSLLEEMADCYICLGLLEMMYGFKRDEIKKAIDVKVAEHFRKEQNNE